MKQRSKLNSEKKTVPENEGNVQNFYSGCVFYLLNDI
jgi:hypothetical protein